MKKPTAQPRLFRMHDPEAKPYIKMCALNVTGVISYPLPIRK
jgi:hypothetical protein